MDIKDLNRTIISEFRANHGKVSGNFAGATLLILSTRGARTGQKRENPLAYIRDNDRYVIIASFAGAPHSPPWFHNLVAHPEVEVEVGSERFTAMASVVPEPERTRLYTRMEQAMPAFTEYKQKTSRVIPVIVLTRKSA
jgi:deazaflavin-dependent oxidoreductase (nitroreductase family)